MAQRVAYVSKLHSIVPLLEVSIDQIRMHLILIRDLRTWKIDDLNMLPSMEGKIRYKLP
jgi:hypothetical protein